MKKLSTLVAVLALTGGLAAQAQQTPPTPKEQTPAAKPDPKAPASIAGKWNLTVETPQGSMANTLEIKLDGKKVTGSLTSQMGTAAIEGEFADGKLAFSMMFESPNGNFQIGWSGVLKADGTMAGTAAVGDMGTMNWVAERMKG
jgi:hypothetical protein